MREVIRLLRRESGERAERSTQRLEAKCKAGDASACDTVLCLSTRLNEASEADLRACAKSRKLLAGATWTQLGRDDAGEKSHANIICLQIVESFDEFGEPGPQRPMILILSKVRDGKLLAPFTVRIGADPRQYPREEFQSLDAAATFGCREAVRRIKEEDRAAH